MRNQQITSDTDFKKYFIQEDNLRSLQNELMFSILRRYNCFAGCQICYVDKYFEKESKFTRHIPTEISQEYTDKLYNVMSHYNFVTTTDDLYWMKHKQPHLFKWYQEHAGAFHFGAMTDNNFIRAWDILKNEIATPKGIYEFTFSDTWLQKVGVAEILSKLEEIYNRIPISQIKLIQTNLTSLGWECIIDFVRWVRDRSINLIIHHDAKSFDTIRLDSEHQQLSFATYDGDMYTVCGEADYMQYDSFFLTLVDSIDPLVEPYDTIEQFSATTHLPKHLNAKKDVYARYNKKLKGTLDKNTKAYNEYFRYVSDNLTVNENYNFIPFLCFNPYHTYFEKLQNEGWIRVDHGLYKPSDRVTPLFNLP